MSHVAELLAPLDLAVLVGDLVLLVFALVSAAVLVVVVAPRMRRGGESGDAAVSALAVIELVALLFPAPVLWLSASTELAKFGAESMLPTVIMPAARAAVPLLLAVIAANVAVAMRRPAS